MTGSDDKHAEPYKASSPGRTFKRAAWKHFSRWIIFVCVAGLNIAMPMSLLERIFKHLMVIDPGREGLQFLFLLFCDLYFLPFSLFEVNCVTIVGEEIIVSNLLWQAKLTKADIVSFQMPKMFVWAILRTRRCFYLINRVDIPNFDELASLIGPSCLQ